MVRQKQTLILPNYGMVEVEYPFNPFGRKLDDEIGKTDAVLVGHSHNPQECSFERVYHKGEKGVIYRRTPLSEDISEVINPEEVTWVNGRAHVSLDNLLALLKSDDAWESIKLVAPIDYNSLLSYLEGDHNKVSNNTQPVLFVRTDEQSFFLDFIGQGIYNPNFPTAYRTNAQGGPDFQSEIDLKTDSRHLDPKYFRVPDLYNEKYPDQKMIDTIAQFLSSIPTIRILKDK